MGFGFGFGLGWVFLSSMLTLLCISVSRQHSNSGGGEQLFSDGYFSNQQKWNILFNSLICSFIYRLFFTFQMDGSFSELINLPRVFNKIIIVTIAQDKPLNPFSPWKMLLFMGKQAKKALWCLKIYQMHTKVNWFHLDDWYLKEFKWHQNR